MTRERQAIYWLVGVTACYLVLVALSGILMPFVFGFAIAYFADPAADKLEEWGLPRWAAATVLTVLMVLGVILILVLLVPLLQSQVVNLASRLPDYVDSLRRYINEILALAQTKLSPEDFAKIKNAIGGFAGDTLSWFERLLGQLWSGGLALVNLLSLILITPVVTFYLLRDWDKFVARVDALLPRRHAPMLRDLARQVNETLAGFARGQAMVCILLGIFYAVALTIAGLDFGLVIGVGTGLITFIPYFGMIMGLVASVGLAIAQFDDWMRVAIVAAIFLVGQVVEGNFVTPKLVGDRVGLHPVWMIFALLAGGSLFGFLGVLLAVPAAATIGVLTRFCVRYYLASPLYGVSEAANEATIDALSDIPAPQAEQRDE